jgi:hypothetical protein
MKEKKHHRTLARKSTYSSLLLTSVSGLPDGKFSNQKSRFGEILEGLAMEDVVIIYGNLVYFYRYMV